MRLNEAIKHALDAASRTDNEKCEKEHLQLAEWLAELANMRKKEVKEYKDKTISQLVDETFQLTKNSYIINNLLQIKDRAEQMEDRLLKYCNAIEDLGFVKKEY